MDLATTVGVLGFIATCVIGAWQIHQGYRSRIQAPPNSDQDLLKDSPSIALETPVLVPNLAEQQSGSAELAVGLYLARTRIKVITDPRFLDSAVFMWMLRNQPLQSLDVRCDLLAADWRSVPEQVASHEYAVGFHNRRSVLRHREKTVYGVKVWSDLCLYKGYALIGRPNPEHAPTFTLVEARKLLRETIEIFAQKGERPTLVCMGADSIWKLYTPFTPEINTDTFAIHAFNNPDLALRSFLEGFGDFFMGGLPQRLVAREHGCIEILNFANNPLLFSVNSLICSNSVYEEHPFIMTSIASVWFETIRKIQRDQAFCEGVAESSIQLLDDLGIDGTILCRSFFSQIFRNASGREYESFPEHPGGVIDELLVVLRTIHAQLSEMEINPVLLHEILDQLTEILNPNLEKERHPLL